MAFALASSRHRSLVTPETTSGYSATHTRIRGPSCNDEGVTNEYTPQWFDVFLESMPGELTTAEVEAIAERLPRPQFQRILDICCGPARHAASLGSRGYEITGIDRDATAVSLAAERCPGGTFIEMDQRDLGALEGPFDAAVILWQSFGYFDSATNDRVLTAIHSVLRPGGRLLLDLFHRGYFERNQGRISPTRDPRCVSITNDMNGSRLASRIEYANGAEETMDFELFTPGEIIDRARVVGFEAIELCCWWDAERRPSVEVQRFQITLERT
jgi:SAM-dependent methyltransferase